MDKQIPPTASRYELIRDSTLPIQQKWLLEVLNRYQGMNPTCWVLQETLAKDCSLQVRQIKRLISELFSQGLITITSPNGPNHCNHYSINEEALLTVQRCTDAVENIASAQGNGQTSGVIEDTRVGTRKTLVGVIEDTTLRGTRKTPGTLPKPPVKRSPNPGREQGRSSIGRGEGVANRLSDAIKVPKWRELFSNVETIRVAHNDNRMVESTRDLATIAGSAVKLMMEIEEETGIEPDPLVIVNATNDEEFSGLKALSWGLLLSQGMRTRFKNQIVRRISNATLASTLSAQNSNDEKARELNETMRGHFLDIQEPDDNHPDFSMLNEED